MSIELSSSTIFMILGLVLAMYSCVSNDVIQTLGTFISANKKKSAWIIWAFSSTILVATLTYGWIVNGGDLAFGRLVAIPYTAEIQWWHVLPPVILLILTKWGMPVSTTFLIISVFSSNAIMGQIVIKSALGYIVAFIASIILYMFISGTLEKRFRKTKQKHASKWWLVALWSSTAFLWSQWIMQDVANIFVYLPRESSVWTLVMICSLFTVFLGILAFRQGGEVQNIVKLKTNTKDIRSASIINIVFALILFYFKQMNSLPMSTTWVFIGLLAGRELAMYAKLKHKSSKKIWKRIGNDFSKATAGLVVSVIVVQLIVNIQYVKQTLTDLIYSFN